MKKVTHEVIDLHYHDDENNVEFQGNYEDCLEYLSTCSPSFMYKIRIIIPEFTL